MTEVVSFSDYTPAPRFDATPWTDIQVEEGAASDGPWTVIDTIPISPLDADPANPESRSFTITNGSAPDLWYRITFVDAGSNLSLPSAPVQNVELTVAPYATVAEFFRIIKKDNPSEAQTLAAQGDLATATLEINAEIDWADDHAAMTAEELALVKGVCLDRAADLWRHRESAPGILGVVDEGVPSTPGRYSFARYVARLSVLKDQWGIA